jgi:hypothetical protein
MPRTREKRTEDATKARTCPVQQCFDLFHDAMSGQWVLDRAYD